MTTYLTVCNHVTLHRMVTRQLTQWKQKDLPRGSEAGDLPAECCAVASSVDILAKAVANSVERLAKSQNACTVCPAQSKVCALTSVKFMVC